MIIILIENGRLGNQIFEYQAARKFAKSGSLLFVGYSLLPSIINDSLTFFPFRHFPLISKFIIKFRRRLLIILKSLKFLSFIEDSLDDAFTIRHGFLKNVYILNGFFQSNKLFSSYLFEPLYFSYNFNNKISASRYYLSTLAVNKQNPLSWYFCHIRRGDYLSWPTSGPAVLPANWFIDCACRILKDPSNTLFIFSDDPFYAFDIFSDTERAIIIHNNLVDDLALMINCIGGAILSPSSFSLFAALTSFKVNPYFLAYAPEYWCGWRIGEWLPNSIQVPWITYIPVVKPVL